MNPSQCSQHNEPISHIVKLQYQREMELPREIVEDILSRIPVSEILPHWRQFSPLGVMTLARERDLPLPNSMWPVSKQLEDLVASSNLDLNKRLAIAAGRGDITAVQRMLDLGATYRNSALRAAAREGQLEIIKFLIKESSDFPSIANAAARGGHLEVVEFLISSSINDYKASAYEQALDTAVSRGHHQIVQLLLLASRDYDRLLSVAAGKGHLEVVKLLILSAKKLNQALINAADKGHLEIVKLLLSHGANNYDVAMIAAARGGHAEVVDLLSDKAYSHDAAIKAASGWGHSAVVELLLDKIIDYNAALIDAAREGHEGVMELLLDKATNHNLALVYAAEGNHLGAIRLILSKGRVSDRRPAIAAAATRHRYAALELLETQK